MVDVNEIKDLEELIKDRINGQVVDQKVTRLLAPGENFASVLYKVDFKVKKDNKIHEFRAVAKCPDPLMRVQDNNQVFKLEISWYTKVIPTLIQFQKDKGLKKTINFFQKIYGTRISLDPTSQIVDLNAVILSENLKYLGYKNINRYLGFDLPTTHIILTNLAMFHAVPLAIRYHNPDLFNTNVKPFLKPWCSDHVMETEFVKPIFEIYRHISEYQSLMDRIRKVVEESNIFQERAIREPWATAIHMDLWSNNIMVTDGRNPKIIVLDLQSPGFASITADLSFFLLTSVQHDVISKNFDDLLKFYYNAFIDNLKLLNVPIKNFSFPSFLSEFDREVKIGELAHALGHIAVVFSECEKMSDKIIVNDKHIKKFKWITGEAEKRKWI